NIVINYTRDIQLRKKISGEEIEKIREAVLNGKTKLQTAKALKCSYLKVLRLTKDIPSQYLSKYIKGYPGIRGKTLCILEEIIRNGYYICTQGDSDKYLIIRKYFLNICRAHVYNKTVLFFEDKSDIAIRGFLEHIDKRRLSFHELKTISKAFKSKLTHKEKHKYWNNS
ncbi:MAG: hypothetical protein QHH13_12780, partial [Melioribacter sp.]|nr:hypothetical protein [Melioribacter sp.]